MSFVSFIKFDLEVSDAQENEDMSSKSAYISQKLSTKSPYTISTSVMPSSIVDEHADHQNQLKPSRDILMIQKEKISNEKNSSEASSDGDNEKIVTTNQFDQKMRNIHKSEKSPLVAGDASKRKRRGTKPFARKDLPKSIESLRLLELNTTIGQEYCNTLQCAHRIGPSFSYLIPISKYMVEEYVTLQFNLAVPLIIDHCHPDVKPIACPVPQSGVGDLPHDYIREQNLTEEVDPSWRLPIGLYLQSAYRFRVQARTVISDNPCSLPANELGHSFIEFILIFQRTCEK